MNKVNLICTIVTEQTFFLLILLLQKLFDSLIATMESCKTISKYFTMEFINKILLYSFVFILFCFVLFYFVLFVHISQWNKHKRKAI